MAALTTAEQKKLKQLQLKQQQWEKEKKLIQRAKVKPKTKKA